MSSDPASQGIVYLVGAGPGDPGLITVRGLELLRSAEVVVYDALANPQLLEHVPPAAQRIDAGKRSRQHTLTQDQTNALLAELAAAGKRVVRLKGGDPYLFGRGAEELIYLAQRGIRCEVVPGVTAGIAAPAAAGIPVTHRQLASSLTFVTGHEDPTKSGSSVDYAALAQLAAAGGTLCFYMGVGRLAEIAQHLQQHGLPGDTPAAVIQWGTLPTQRSVRSSLTTIAQRVAEAGMTAPAIIVVGQVAGIDEPGLDYFEKRPLFGQRIVVTRTRQQASDLRLLLEAQGAQVIEAPTITTVEPDTWQPVDDTLRSIHDYHWLILTSTNAVDVLAARLDQLQLDARHLASVRIAAVGSATAARLWQSLHLRADLVPTQFVAESLAGELISREPIADQRVLLLRADIARPELERALTQAGARVTDLVAYRTQPADALPPAVVEGLQAGQIDWITFTSSSTARNLVQLLGSDRPLLDRPGLKFASIGPVTSQTLRELGLPVTVEPENATVAALVEAMVHHARST